MWSGDLKSCGRRVPGLIVFCRETAMPSHQVDWVFLGPLDCPEVHVGDVICADAGGLPAYRVLSLDGARARLRSLDTAAERLAPLAAFHWKAA